MSVPNSWNPVKVDGDHAAGSVLLADLHSARLGLRWKRAPKRGQPADWVTQSIRDEVGKLAADEAVDVDLADRNDWSAAKLYVDPDPPGRDIFVAHSHRSDRIIQIVHHAAKRSKHFADELLPSLADTSTEAGNDWAMFDLSFRTPPGISVRWYRFNAGDLACGLADAKGRITVVRQIGPAGLALGRQPLANWLMQVPKTDKKLYRPIASTEPTTIDTSDGRTLDGLVGTLRRKRRLFWVWTIAKRQKVLAFHDAGRDRLIVGQGEDETLTRRVLATAGWQRVMPPSTEGDA
ncbi:MAG: hypothetical protein QM754_10025 [Tepidisphaeraceae bacterium]